MKSQKIPKFSCEICKYITESKKDYNKHLTTSKHKLSTLSTEVSTIKIPNVCICICICGKKFKDRTGLWYHKKKCNVNEFDTKESNVMDSDSVSISVSEKALLYKMVESNEAKNEMIIELQKQLIESLNKPSTVNNNNNNNNNNNTQNNNQFNLQMYLNETCSNAMNIDTFLKNINVTIENVIEIGEIGYSKGIGNLIAKHINAMKQTDKPIQTTDVKRGLSWIKNKDNEWVKDEDLALGNNLILFVGDKYFRKYNVGYKTIEEWRDGQSRIHAKIIKSLHQIATTVSTDDRSGYYSKIHKIIAENTVIKK